MKAIVQDEYGSADVLEFRDIDMPDVGDDEVLVRVHAAGLDAGVWHTMTGLPYMIRIMGFGFRAPKAQVRGTDVAGRVEDVGKNVTGWQPGDDVYGTSKGSFAEFAVAGADALASKPANLTFEQAAVVPTSAITALQGLRDHGKVEAGQQVLILGASGGVGSFAVQLAKAFGAEVTGVASTSKVDAVRALGADHVIDYTQEDFAKSGERYDMILDIAGNRSLSQLRGSLTPKGTLVIVGGEEGGRWLGGTDRLLRALVVSPFVGQKLRTFIAKEGREDLEYLTGLIEAGSVTPLVDRSFPLSEVPDAIRYFDEGHGPGKIVITV